MNNISKHTFKFFFVMALALITMIPNKASSSPYCLSCSVNDICPYTVSHQSVIDGFSSSFPGCTTVRATITFKESIAGNITNLNGFSNITEITGDLKIGRYSGGNTALSSLAGLHNMTSVGGRLYIPDNISNFTLQGSLEFHHNPALASLDSLNISNTAIEGDLVINDNDALSNLEGLNAIEHVKKSLIIQDNLQLSDISALENLTTIEGGLSINNNTAITSLSDLNGLQTIKSTLNIQNNANLTSIGNLNSLTALSGILQLINNPQLSTLSGLDHIDGDELSGLVLLGNGALSSCGILPICAYLYDTSSTAYVSGNLSGCSSRTEIVNACNATFPLRSLSYSAGSNGNVTGNTAQTLYQGLDGEASTANPDAGYHFLQWSDGVTDNPRIDLNVTADIAVTAEFATGGYIVSPIVIGTGGVINPSAQQTVNYNDTTTFTFSPSINYELDSVVGSCGGNLSNNTYTTAAITNNCSVIATFIKVPALLSPVPGVTLSNRTQTFTWTDNGQSIDNYRFNIGSSGVGSANIVSSEELDGTVNNFTVPEILVADGITLYVRLWFKPNGAVSRSIDYTYIAGFPPFNLTYTANSQGYISGDNAQTVHFGLDGTTVTAVPYVGYQFWQWQTLGGSIYNGSSRQDTNISADITANAEFKLIQYTLSSSVIQGQGTITAMDNSQVHYGDTRQFSVVADPSYSTTFVVGSCGGNLVGTIFTTDPIVSDCSVEAIFANSPTLNEPSPGSQLNQATISFSWSDNHFPVTNYKLYAGSSLAASDIYDSGDLGTMNEVVMTGIPFNDDTTLYVRLSYKVNGLWSSLDYLYKTGDDFLLSLMPAILSAIHNKK